MPTTALIVAAGAGVRMGRAAPKALLDLEGRPLLEHSLARFSGHPGIARIVLMAPASSLREVTAIASGHARVIAVGEGGASRQETVRLGLALLARTAGPAGAGELILVHDAARPLVSSDLISAVLEAASRHGAAVPGLAPADTVRRVREADPSISDGTLDRAGLVLVQTPQGFQRSLLERACGQNDVEGATDDAALVERLGHPVRIVAGDPGNLKITTPVDLIVAAALMRAKER